LQETDCVAGVGGLELRNVDANYLFERSHRFAGIQPNSGFGDYSGLSGGARRPYAPSPDPDDISLIHFGRCPTRRCDRLRQSLGTAVLFGMLGVTCFGLLFTPAFYTFIRKLGRKRDGGGRSDLSALSISRDEREPALSG
jgi:hypothetical protein